MTEYKITQRVGALYRRQIRRTLMQHNIPYTEDKALVDSLFVIRPTSKPQYDALMDWLTRIANAANTDD